MEKGARRAILQNEPCLLYGKGYALSSKISKENAAFPPQPFPTGPGPYAPPTRGKNSSSPLPLEAQSSATRT